MLFACASVVGLAKILIKRATARRNTRYRRINLSGNMQSTKISDVAKIEEIQEHPIDLFRIWHDEARRYNPKAPDACCLATVSREYEVSARNVVLREFDNEGFVIVTDRRSKKASNIKNVPRVAMCFMWFYVNEKEEEITKQVRVEGVMKMLEKENVAHLYDREALFCKIRSHLCDQGCEVDWEELKQRHDEILNSVRCGKNNLPMPDHFAGYKLSPTMMEFYYARDYLISDRILYEKNASDGSWKHRRIAA